jgi:hypothetical protein
VVYEIDKLSSLSTAEFIKLVGHYNYLASGKPDINPQIQNRGYSAAALAEAKKQNEALFNPVTSLGLTFRKPLSNFKSDVLSYSLTLFENYERGALPFPGSVSEQPAQIMEIFGVLQALRHEREAAERKKLEKNVGNKHQGKRRISR